MIHKNGAATEVLRELKIHCSKGRPNAGKITAMGGSSTYRVRETLLSRRPRNWSLEVAALSVVAIQAVSLLAWRNGGALLPTLAATSEGVLKEHEYWRLLTGVAVHADGHRTFASAVATGFAGVDILHPPRLLARPHELWRSDLPRYSV